MKQSLTGFLRLTAAMLALGGGTAAGFAQDLDSPTGGSLSDRLDYFVFGSVMTEGTFPGWTNIPFAAPLDDDYLVGGAVNYELLDAGHGFHFGAEVGLAARFGSTQSAEAWGGMSMRHDGFSAGPVSVGFGLVVGLSAVTGTTGIEARREAAAVDGDATLLYYAGPELSLRYDKAPNMEFVFRTHHRSGAANVSFLPTLGNLAEGSNANSFGIRFRY